MTDEIECKTKKWGSSIGIVIPSEIVKKENIKPDETIKVVIKKTPLAKILLGLGPVKDKRPTEEIIKELRKGW